MGFSRRTEVHRFVHPHGSKETSMLAGRFDVYDSQFHLATRCAAAYCRTEGFRLLSSVTAAGSAPFWDEQNLWRFEC